MLRRIGRFVAVALAGAMLNGGRSEAASPWDRLSHEIMRSPEKAAGRLLSHSSNLFSVAWLSGDVAYFLKKPLPVLNLPDVCAQEGFAMTLDDRRRPVRFQAVQRYAEIGGRVGATRPGPQLRSCDQLQTYFSNWTWAPSGRTMIRAVDLLLGAAAAAAEGDGPLPFELVCSDMKPCPSDRRAELAQMRRLRFVNVRNAPCAAGRECYAVQVWDGGADQRYEWTVTLVAEGSLRRLELSDRGFLVVDHF
jgi:hypothetical protein